MTCLYLRSDGRVEWQVRHVEMPQVLTDSDEAFREITGIRLFDREPRQDVREIPLRCLAQELRAVNEPQRRFEVIGGTNRRICARLISSSGRDLRVELELASVGRQ